MSQFLIGKVEPEKGLPKTGEQDSSLSQFLIGKVEQKYFLEVVCMTAKDLLSQFLIGKV